MRGNRAVRSKHPWQGVATSGASALPSGPTIMELLVTTPRELSLNRPDRRVTASHDRRRAPAPRYLRFADLVALGVISNRVTLGRWMEGQNFPRPVRLGENTVAWVASEIDGWLADRERARASRKNRPA